MPRRAAFDWNPFYSCPTWLPAKELGAAPRASLLGLSISIPSWQSHLTSTRCFSAWTGETCDIRRYIMAYIRMRAWPHTANRRERQLVLVATRCLSCPAPPRPSSRAVAPTVVRTSGSRMPRPPPPTGLDIVCVASRAGDPSPRRRGECSVGSRHAMARFVAAEARVSLTRWPSSASPASVLRLARRSSSAASRFPFMQPRSPLSPLPPPHPHCLMSLDQAEVVPSIHSISGSSAILQRFRGHANTVPMAALSLMLCTAPASRVVADSCDGPLRPCPPAKSPPPLRRPCFSKRAHTWM
ncbi:hypothetical protein CDD83_4813 [Cordyceps sp. RAO-2017]|nr:hypothetical protein CDD83_4813 [Cordyceps sp. RAO-2017]